MYEEEYSSDTTSSSESMESSDDCMESSDDSMESNDERVFGFGYAFGIYDDSDYSDSSDESSSELEEPQGTNKSNNIAGHREHLLSVLPAEGSHHAITGTSHNLVVVHQTERITLLATHSCQIIDDLGKKFSIKNNEQYNPFRYVKDERVPTTLDEIELFVANPQIYTLYSLNELNVLCDVVPAIPLSPLLFPGVYLITKCSKKVVNFMYLNNLSRFDKAHTIGSLKKSIERYETGGGHGVNLLTDEMRRQVLQATAEVRNRAR